MAAPRWTKAVTACLLLSAAAAGQSQSDQLVKAYEKKLLAELIATGQRHVDLGWSIKDKGLIPQATYQFVLAVELSENKHRGASMVLNIVRTYEEAFWKKRRKKPRKGALKAYEKKAAAIVEKDMKGQVLLARAASKAKMTVEMTEHLLKAMQYGAEIDFPKDERKSGAKIEGFKIDQELAKWLLDQTVEVNGGERRFEPVSKAPRLEGLSEVADDGLIVRTDLGAEIAKGLHALGSALREPLADRLDGSPVRPLRLVVFARRQDYDAYLQASGHGKMSNRGLCDYGRFQCLICAEGLDDSSRNALVLHELTHLFFFGASPIAMPDWYMEGLAETFGGQGTFVWDQQKLQVGGLLRSARLDALQQQPMTLQQVLAGNALNLMRDDPDQAQHFYAMSWALMRYLTTGKHGWRSRFEAWEAKCRGALPGRTSTRGFGTSVAAQQAFLAEFGKDLEAIEQGFRAWLAEL